MRSDKLIGTARMVSIYDSKYDAIEFTRAALPQTQKKPATYS